MVRNSNLILRVYNFDTDAYGVGDLGVYIKIPVDSEATAIYESALPLTDREVFIGYPTYKYVTGFYISFDDIPSGTDVVEVGFTLLEDGVAIVIDPFNPIEYVNLARSQFYSGGIVEIGAYINGTYNVMGSVEISSDDAWITKPIEIALTAAEAPETPRFWTEFKQAVEFLDGPDQA